MPKVKGAKTKKQQAIQKKINCHGYCPHCNADLDGENMIDTFKRMRDKGSANGHYKGWTDKQIQDMVSSNYSAPYIWGRQIGIEYQGSYDGILRWQCPDCKGTWDRFSEEEKKNGKQYYYDLIKVPNSTGTPKK